jgi:O-antigen/teichoic acid export membrane protein
LLKQKFLVQFGSTFFLKIVAMLAGIVVARVAGPEVIGTIAFGTAYVSVFGFIKSLFSTGHIKLISEGQDLGSCNSTYTVLQGGSILFYFLLVSSWFLFQKIFLNYSFESKEQQIVIVLLLFANIASNILDFNNVTFTARLEQAKANYPLFVKSLVWQLGRILIVIIGFKAVGLATWNLIISILILPLAWKLYKQIPRSGFHPQLAKRYLSFVPPIALIVFFQSILLYSDKLILSYYTSLTELGYYSAAFAVGGVFLLVSKATGLIFFPLFSKFIASGNWESVNHKIKEYQDFNSLFVLPAILCAVLIGEPFLLLLLGDVYYPSILPFKILLIATYVSIIGMPYGNVISGMGKFYLIALINFVQLVVFLFFIVFFISPSYLNLGATGLALNLLTVNIFANIMYLFVSNRIGKIVYQLKPLISSFVIVIVFAIIAFVPYYLAIEGFVLIIFGFFFLIITYFSLFSLSLINKRHFEILYNIIDLKKLYAYVIDELGFKK